MRTNVTSPSNVTNFRGGVFSERARTWAVFNIKRISLKLGLTNLRAEIERFLS